MLAVDNYAKLDIRVCKQRAVDLINTINDDRCLRLAWLGQAGFALKYGGFSALLDPYLSNSLAAKYIGTKFPHIRMMQPPLQPEEPRNLDLVLCSHRHSDHMDPGTLPTLIENNPNCKIVVPRAEICSAHSLGISGDIFTPVNAGDVLNIGPGIGIEIIPSAHEQLKTNNKGEHHFLGFILKFGNVTVYHSGDCIPYDNLLEHLRGRQIDMALLPVNGRDEYRTSNGIAGNFTFDEAAVLCKSAGIPVLLGHHYGMFDFNTINEDELRVGAEGIGEDFKVILPKIGEVYELRKVD